MQNFHHHANRQQTSFWGVGASMSDITEFAEPVNPTEYNNVVTIIRNSFKVIPSLVCLLTNSQERSQIHTSLLRFPPYLLCRPTTPHRKSSSWYFSVTCRSGGRTRRSIYEGDFSCLVADRRIIRRMAIPYVATHNAPVHTPANDS